MIEIARGVWNSTVGVETVHLSKWNNNMGKCTSVVTYLYFPFYIVERIRIDTNEKKIVDWMNYLYI